MMKSAPTLKLGNVHIRYIQVPYDNRYFVFKSLKFPNEEIKIPCNCEWILEPLFQSLVQDAGYGSLEFNYNLKRYHKFLERVQKRDEYLDRD